ncbi:MAG: DUF4407 domain-containing protein [Akkermansiaceae bacterium]|nr:DUF4407 domain-containing protein [Akkermansiaceae bacterium]
MILKTFKHIFFWLSGAGAETLEQCPNWEQRKYVAFGATILVPTVFAFIACAYAVSTLTDNWQIILPVAAAWGFIILTIDRALLATYRSFQSFQRKIGQFALRMVVAALMGVTIAHPLTLLLFKDTIHTVIEDQRGQEIQAAQEKTVANQQVVQDKIDAVEAQITSNHDRFNKTYEAEFLVEDTTVGEADPSSELDAETRAQMEEKLKIATAPVLAKIEAADAKIEELSTKYETLQAELDFWQREFEREVNGQRSGIPGEGPRARSIREDQLAWRRDEAKRIGEMLAFQTQQRDAFTADRKMIEDQIKADYVAIAADKAELRKAERERIAALKREVQEVQATQFAQQQSSIRESIKAQIDIRQQELENLQEERAQVVANGQDRIEAIKAEPRRDILTQTLALHGLFEKKEKGGEFALVAYAILALLFMLVDTIPLIVKFFTKPGPYDALVDCEEVRFDRERKTFLESYNRYMEELSAGRLLHLSPANKPLERSLIEGVDRSRAAKEFIEHLMDLERSFQEKIASEREALAAMAKADADASSIHTRTEMLEEMSRTFYEDLRGRMSSFFEDPQAAKAAASIAPKG